MERGDIYLVALDPTAGHEQQGKRPVLVISPGRFNRLTGVPIVLPITTGGGFARTAGFAVSLTGPEHERPASFAAISRARSICAPGAARRSKPFQTTSSTRS
jgi:mRNA-degrading endonuclease toxin of MazEF toxin-antitoxin module